MSRIIKIAAIDDNLVFGSSGSMGSGFVKMLRGKQKKEFDVVGRVETVFELKTESDNDHIRALLDVLAVKRAFYFAGHSTVKTITENLAKQELEALRTSLKLLNKIHSLQVFTYSSSVLASLPNDYLTSLHKTEFLDQLMLYAETKLRAESIISDFLKSPSIKYVLLNRYTNVFGTHPFGTDSLFSYVLNQIFKPNSVIEIHSAKNSRVNFVYDTEVHKKLIEYVSNLDFDGGPHLRTNYIAESRSLTLGDWMNRFLNAINPDCVELVYGNRPTFWDFFCDPSPLISPDSFENYLGFQRMCKNIARIR